jgi:hypothetical protein
MDVQLGEMESLFSSVARPPESILSAPDPQAILGGPKWPDRRILHQ